jgi:saccharopine dehydrogenase-like NADP-dependent oxidoreductase
MSKANVVLLGLGMQGKAALSDLVNNSAAQIVVADISPELEAYLRRYPSDRVSGQRVDVTDEMDLASLMRDADVVIESLPSTFTLPVSKLAAKLGINLVSSSYYLDPAEQDTLKIETSQKELRWVDREAKEKGATILTGFGMDPGIDLVLGTQALSEMDDVEEFYSYGAGLPTFETSNNPLKYKFSWSIIGVMRSYLRPAKLISNGKLVEIEAKEMFAPENKHILHLEEFEAPLECYPNGNSVYYAELFGIRDSIREMARYTCRWPGHGAFWEIMAKCGFLDHKPLKVDGLFVSPAKFTASLLGSQNQFHYADDEQDVTLIRVDVRGLSKGKKTRIVYQLIDRRDLKTGFTSMQRTVGFTLSLGARLILEGQLKKSGLLSAIDVPFDLVAQELKRHDMHISRQELPWK